MEVRLTDHPDMISAVYHGCKERNQTNIGLVNNKVTLNQTVAKQFLDNSPVSSFTILSAHSFTSNDSLLCLKQLKCGKGLSEI